MPRIFDNSKQPLLDGLKQTFSTAHRADFCVGYFNLRGWRELGPHLDGWPGGEDHCCRLMIGMQGRPEEVIRQIYRLNREEQGIDQGQVKRLVRQAAEAFREQLMFGAPNNADEQGLRDLARQMREKKLVVKLYLRHPLHAKLYLLFRDDYNNPITGFVGSSNLTLAGLRQQGELNVDVLDQDACRTLAGWFEDRWQDNWCVDITSDLIAIIEESWVRQALLKPYEIYLKIAYHLSQEARAGLSEFKLPRDLAERLFDFQAAAVRIAAHHLNKRGGVMLGDVVGLGKTLMATALARIFQDDHSFETLIICPKNLVRMWAQYVTDYRLLAKVMPLSMVTRELPDLRRYRLVILDESHNLRNRESKTYRVIQEYVTANESKCILLSATPYNKSFADLSSQLGLFIEEGRDLGIRPERYVREMGGEIGFAARHQVPVRSLAAFERSEFIEDWRELMRLFLVRRTRSFILDNYAETDPDSGRRFLRMRDNRRFFFPTRKPVNVPFDADAQYAALYSDTVVDLINGLNLPRYGLGQYVNEGRAKTSTADERRQIENLSRAGKRLMGFCRTNLFKRLESSGSSFLQSVDRHILRNFVYLHAIENGLPLPIGTLDADMLDTAVQDEDDQLLLPEPDDEQDTQAPPDDEPSPDHHYSETAYRQRAEQVYRAFGAYGTRLKWLNPGFFVSRLREDLEADTDSLLQILSRSGEWQPDTDAKIAALVSLLNKHRGEKVLIFSQFADTVRYLYGELTRRGVQRLAMATGGSEDPTLIAWRFSPISNGRDLAPGEELNILIATDVLSEGQNLQDCAIIVNYDLPWAIIRLVQRAGRVDRIGQEHATVHCYSFLPPEGVEHIIRLRARVRQRLHENGEVVGSDERFFEDDDGEQQLRDLYTEKSGILDAESDAEVDLASYAYQIWSTASKADPDLAARVAALPNVVFATRAYTGSPGYPQGVLVYMKTADGTDSLAWIDEAGNTVTQSQLAILKAAECSPETPGLPRHPEHHALVQRGVELMIQEERSSGGQLGRPTSARHRAYTRLLAHRDRLRQTAPLFVSGELDRAIDDIYRYPLRSTAVDTLNRQMRAGISDDDLAQLVIALRADERLSLIHEDGEAHEPYILCSMGLFSPDKLSE